MSYTDLKMLIDGEWTSGTSGKFDDVTDPATDEVLGQVPHASAAGSVTSSNLPEVPEVHSPSINIFKSV